ncbi:MAG TPA: hypothetical protein PLV93_10360 [Microthrixaceae bacterium]|nr:hypothetical protein [Microthrixaceae bacterium]
MPSQTLIDAFTAAKKRHTSAVADLVPLLVEMSLMTVVEVIPGAETLETEGEMNEDWIFTLRIQRVLDGDGAVLYDTTGGHDDPTVEKAIDEVGVEYLDLLLDLTGDDFLGSKRLGWEIA